MNTILSAILVLSVAGPTPATVSITEARSHLLQTETTWEDVETFFEAHATVRDEATEALLREEADAGVKTWALAGAMSGGGSRSLGSTDLAPLDGPGVGWPSASRVVRFATASERNIAAGLIDDVTWAATRRQKLSFNRPAVRNAK